jgi:hypothetical protein
LKDHHEDTRITVVDELRRRLAFRGVSSDAIVSLTPRDCGDITTSSPTLLRALIRWLPGSQRAPETCGDRSNFGTDETAEPLSGERVAPCIDCHTKHAAVEMTFVQFYPTLLEIARQKGTLKPGH